MQIRNPKALPGQGTDAYCPTAKAIVTMHTDTCDWCGQKHELLPDEEQSK